MVSTDLLRIFCIVFLSLSNVKKKIDILLVSFYLFMFRQRLEVIEFLCKTF